MTRFSALALTLALLGAPAPADPQVYGQDEAEAFAHLTLKGVRTVAVNVSDVDEVFERYGVDAERVRGRLEERLRAGGLQVVSRQEAFDDPTAAMLQVNLYVSHLSAYFNSYAVQLKLKQKVPLPADPKAFISVSVWTDKVGGIMGQGEELRVLDALDQSAAHFLEAHRLQNAG